MTQLAGEGLESRGAVGFELVEGAGARFPRGFRCAGRHCGLKASGRDLSLFVSDVDAAAAAVFTTNRFAGAPVVLGRETIRGAVLRAVVVNSKYSNVGLGERGVADARRMAEAAARELGTDPGRVLVASTGVIGVPLPIEKVEAGLRGISAALTTDPLVGAEGMMTTDTHPKALSLTVGDATITVVAKGAGMVSPNLATMLVYIFTDAAVAAEELDACLRVAVRDSFNMLSIDTDTSTSDMCAVLANGLAGEVDAELFGLALRAACIRMAELLARDGEGATKLLRVRVVGADTDGSARRVARAVVDSPLIKTMAFGADPNVGRIMMAVGKCSDIDYDPNRVSATINGIGVIAAGQRVDYDTPSVRAALSGDPVDIVIDLEAGAHAATAFGCDLTAGYVEENAAYTSS